MTPYIVEEEEELSQTLVSQALREWYEQEEQRREAMENHDFKKTDDDVLEIKEHEPERILPPSRIRDSGKTTTEPFRR